LVRDNPAANSSFSTGALIEELTAGGAALAAGLKKGDVIVSFAGQRVNGASDLTAVVRAQPAGAKVEVEALRDETLLTFNVTLGDASDLN
jgi:putative serine protease PepD